MTIMKASRGNPDGLDEVFEAYQMLRRLFEAAESVAIEYETGFCEVLLRIPGSGEMVDPNDHNPLNALEEWLVEECAKRKIEFGEAS